MDNQSPAFLLHKLVAEMDKIAHGLLMEKFGLSYKRFCFLHTIHTHTIVSQHQLAVALGYSDPAISAMLQALAQDGYIVVETSSQHARKRIVRLTPNGAQLADQSSRLLNDRFAKVMDRAKIDNKLYANWTQRLLKSLADGNSIES